MIISNASKATKPNYIVKENTPSVEMSIRYDRVCLSLVK